MLVEVRRRLGGAAYSFAREGLEMDNGQHVFLRCCLAYRAFLRRLGSERLVRVQPRLEIPVLSPGKPTTTLRRSRLPAPLHLAGALATYPHLSLRQRLGAARAALALTRVDPDRPALDEVGFGEWLGRHGQSPDAVAALWDLIALPTLNVPAAQASLAQAAFVFRTGLLSAADAGDIGFHDGTLGETIGAPAGRALRRAGVDVRLGWRAERLTHDGGRRFELHGQAAGEEEAALSAGAVIVALPHGRAAALIGPLAPAPAERMRRLASSPIVNLHLLFDREVCELPFAAGVGTPVQYLFDRSAAAGAPAGGQYLAVSLSGAAREMQDSVEQLRARYVPAVEALLPRARDARLLSFLVTREHAATFAPTPGARALRPPARTQLAGLLLAGAHTDTGWPATLEGAVQSGHRAAALALSDLGIGSDPEQTPLAAVGS
jgi:squalene-associated FAD-dependent desaturase